MTASAPNPDRIDIRAALKQGFLLLRTAHVPSDTLAAEILLIHATKKDRTWLYTHPEEFLSPEIATNYFALLRRRAHGEPTQHLTGKQEFWGLEFEVNANVLIPRPETEHLIEVALDRLAVRELQSGRPQMLIGRGLRILDVGTGSGCIAVALAKELSGAEIFATDISAAALAVAQRNATYHSLADQIHFLESNLLAGLPHSLRPISSHEDSSSGGHDFSRAERVASSRALAPEVAGNPLLFDLIVSNPPYIGRREAASLPVEVRDHEPHTALFGGEEGYELYAELILQSARQLKSGGLIVLELGHNSLRAVQPLLDSPHWKNVAVTNDLAGIPRVLSAERL
jgi:release factor glutamine methyltransferase